VIEQDETHVRQPAHREAAVAAWISVIVNVLLMVAKGVVGLWTGSRALFADAAHSAADLSGSVAVMIGLRVARKPPDEDHPYGHGKAELISTALVACLLMAASLDVGYRSIHAFWSEPSKPQWLSAYAAMAAIVIKELLYRYNYRLGKKLNSKSLLAIATDHRSDVYSSIAALVGILLSLAGEWLGLRWLLYMDAVAGAFVALLVLKMGYAIAMDSTQLLMDRAVAEEDLKPYHALIQTIPGVIAIDELRARDHGTYVIVDVKIQVDATITVAEGHGIAAEVKRQMMRDFPRVHDVFVHVNPSHSNSRQESECP
jgi:cation diffusion facilitator family transporter